LSASALAWRRDGVLAVGQEDGVITLWKGKACIATLDSFRYSPHLYNSYINISVAALAWRSDGFLASGSHDGRVQLWGVRGFAYRHAATIAVNLTQVPFDVRELIFRKLCLI